MQPLMHASKSWGRQGGSSGQAMMHASKSWGRQEVPQVQLLMHSFASLSCGTEFVYPEYMMQNTAPRGTCGNS